MITVGLTGQSGSGKTTISKIFEECGFTVINADKIAASVMEKGHPCLDETVRCFGKNILNPDSSLNRKKLAEIVFSDKSSLDRLNMITYPHINKSVLEMLNIYEKNGIKFVLLDAPTLFESGEDKSCDIIVSAFADISLRRERITKRDNISVSAAEKRFGSQLDTEFFVQNSHYVIENNGSLNELTARTKEIIKEITEKYQQ